MSIKIMAAVFDAKIPKVQVGKNSVAEATMKAVLLAMADHANDEGKSIYPSVQRLCDMTGLEDRTVQRAQRALAQIGIIRQTGVSRYGTTEYQIIPSSLFSLRRRGDVESPPDSDTPGGVNENHRGGDSEYKKADSESPEPSYKPSNKPEKKTCPILKTMTDNKIKMNVMTVGAMIADWKKVHSDEWIIRAIESSHGKHVNYVDKILLSWESDGYPPERKAPPQSKTQPEPVYQDEPDPLEGKRMSASEYKTWKAAKDAKGN
jgi:hypothetical protein